MFLDQRLYFFFYFDIITEIMIINFTMKFPFNYILKVVAFNIFNIFLSHSLKNYLVSTQELSS